MPGPKKDIAKHKMWLGVIQRFETSGMSQGKFCDQEKVPVKRFVYWYRRYRDGKLGGLREAAKGKARQKQVLIPVKVMPPEQGAGGTVEILVVRIGADVSEESLRRVFGCLLRS